jgi:tetratricopeptide (TPR) repeat protein
VRLDLRGPLDPLGELDRNLAYLREAETLALALDDQRRLGWIAAYRSADSWRRGDNVQAREFAQRALSIARSLNDARLERYGIHRLANVNQTLGDFRGAIELYQQVIESGEAADGREVAISAVAGHWLARCLAQIGRFADAAARAEQTLRLAESIDHPYSLVMGYRAISIVSLLKGDAEKAVPLLERAIVICRAADLVNLFDGTIAQLGYAHAQAGRPADGIPLMDEALKHSASTGTTHFPLYMSWLSEAYATTGRVDEALALATRALEWSRELSERGYEAYALRLLGELASHRRPLAVEQADGLYREAMALAGELAMRPLAAHCQMGLGRLYSRAGDRATAREHLAAAAAIYREMDMRSWLARAEAEGAML